jgi:hypothetical protein
MWAEPSRACEKKGFERSKKTAALDTAVTADCVLPMVSTAELKLMVSATGMVATVVPALELGQFPNWR